MNNSEFMKESLRKEFRAFREVNELVKKLDAYSDQETKEYIEKRLRRSESHSCFEDYNDDVSL